MTEEILASIEAQREAAYYDRPTLAERLAADREREAEQERQAALAAMDEYEATVIARAVGLLP
mgnify:CR=1 FL=1